MPEPVLWAVVLYANKLHFIHRIFNEIVTINKLIFMLLYRYSSIGELSMKHSVGIIALTSFLLASSSSWAQLPSNPWAPHPNDGYFGDNVANTDITKAPVYENTSSGGEILPVDPWARARDKSGIKTWRGSGQHGKLNYIGEATTYTDAKGQEMIAPEVNRHNMNVALQHLRKMGYKIPESYDKGISDMPKNYAKKLREAYDGLLQADVKTDPLGGMANGMMEGFEIGTGLDIENLLFNSIDILSTD